MVSVDDGLMVRTINSARSVDITAICRFIKDFADSYGTVWLFLYHLTYWTFRICINQQKISLFYHYVKLEGIFTACT